MDRQEAVHAAAQAVIDHANHNTDPATAVNAMQTALDHGATHADIATEIRTIRGH